MAAWYSSRLIRRLALLALLLLAAGVICTVYYNKVLDAPLKVTPGTLFRIDRGVGLNRVLADITRQGLVQSPVWLLQFHARITAAEGSLKAGEYLIPVHINSRKLLALFRSGKVFERQITLPEGLTFARWLDRLHANQYLKQQYTEAALGLILGGQHPEGQFFPDTYSFVLGESDLDILQRAHARMTAISSAIWRAQGAHHALESRADLLILASMIEKETAAPADRRTIASVFANRLRRHMRLQSDPSVIYAIEYFDGNLTRAHLRQPTPYNTYTIMGLPPTPICNPGSASLEAAMNPANTPYLYFVAKGDGYSQFSQTLPEHNIAVARYQRTASVRANEPK